MFSADGLDALMQHVFDQLGIEIGDSPQGVSPGGKKEDDCNGKGKKDRPTVIITPQKLAVIAGLLTNVLEVRSVLVDRSQILEIVLDGTLKRKTPIDKIFDQVGPLSFDLVMGAIADRFIK